MKRLVIVIVQGWKILENITRGFANVTLVPTEAQIFRKIDKDHIDFALYSRLTEYSRIYQIEPPIAQRPMYLYLHKDYSEFAESAVSEPRVMIAGGSYQRIYSESIKGIDE